MHFCTSDTATIYAILPIFICQVYRQHKLASLLIPFSISVQNISSFDLKAGRERNKGNLIQWFTARPESKYFWNFTLSLTL